MPSTSTGTLLREAIAFAEPGATITFAPGLTGTIGLSSEWSRLLINKSLTIVGPGASTLTVDGQMSEYGIAPFVISSAAEIEVEIRGLTVTGGNEGGFYVNAQQVLLDGVVITGNTRADGIYGGAGIFHFDGALTLRNSTVVGNTAYGNGGGIASYQGSLTLENSTVSGNSASAGCSQGGGVRTMPLATLTLTNSTVSGNTACQGGGIDASDEGATLAYSTVTNNTGDYGAGIAAYGPLVLTSSIVTGNTGTGVDLLNYGTGTTVTYSLLGSTDGYEFSGSNNLLGASPLLGPLASNRGPTQTHALLSGSPAINYVPLGTNGCGSTITTDQRATARPQPTGGACDAGAFESVSSFTPSCTYTINRKNGQRAVTVSWADAEPGVTKVEIADGRVAAKQMAPTASGSWSTNVKTDPTYGIWGGTNRKDNYTVLVPAGTGCMLQ